MRKVNYLVLHKWALPGVRTLVAFELECEHNLLFAELMKIDDLCFPIVAAIESQVESQIVFNSSWVTIKSTEISDKFVCDRSCAYFLPARTFFRIIFLYR